jgi:hypothetical protein
MPSASTESGFESRSRYGRFLKRHNIPRTRLFQWTTALEGILSSPPSGTEHQPSSPVDIETGELPNPRQSPKGEVRPDGNVQLCLDF